MRHRRSIDFDRMAQDRANAASASKRQSQNRTTTDVSPNAAALELQPHFAMPPQIDATERYLLQLFLRRYVTWCARRGRFKQMQGAARLHRQIA